MGFCFYGGLRGRNRDYCMPDKGRGLACVHGGVSITDSTFLEISRVWGFTTILQGNVTSVEGELVPEYSLSLLVKLYETQGWVRIQAATLHLCPTAAHTL